MSRESDGDFWDFLDNLHGGPGKAAEADAFGLRSWYESTLPNVLVVLGQDAFLAISHDRRLLEYVQRGFDPIKAEFWKTLIHSIRQQSEWRASLNQRDHHSLTTQVEIKGQEMLNSMVLGLTAEATENADDMLRHSTELARNIIDAINA